MRLRLRLIRGDFLPSVRGLIAEATFADAERLWGVMGVVLEAPEDV